MKIYKTQAEVDSDIVDGVLTIECDVSFEFPLNVEAKIVVNGDINAGNINAGDINAWDINARNISFYAVAFAYSSFKCKSIIGRRKNSKYFCLDKEVEIREINKLNPS